MSNAGALVIGLAGFFMIYLSGYLTSYIISYNQEKFYNETMEKIEECQKTLPRNVECVIVAVPEDEMEDES